MALADPMTYQIQWEYTGCAQIRTISNKNGSATNPRYYYEFTYTGGRLTQVRDPAPLHNQVQRFAYFLDVSGHTHAVYTDRRGEEWEYVLSGSYGNLTGVTDPLGHVESYQYANAPPALVHEKMGYVNALGKTWLATYDLSGNVLTARDPLGHVTTFTYDALNNLLTVTPPLDALGNGNPAKRVTYHHDNPSHPTSVTSIEEPPAAAGGPVPVTTLEYYTFVDDPPTERSPWWGLLKQVTDPNRDSNGNPNGVVTRYEYDQWGQPWRETENPDGGDRSPIDYYPTLTFTQTHNAAGLATGGSHCGLWHEDCGYALVVGQVTRDANGRIQSVQCNAVLPVLCPINPTQPEPFGIFASGCFNVDAYMPEGQPTGITRCIGDPATGESEPRYSGFTYDVTGRTLSEQVRSTEPIYGNPRDGGEPIVREFLYAYNDVQGTVQATGPDGQTRLTESNTVGRVWRVTRTLPGGGYMQAVYTYDAANRVSMI